MVRWWVAGSLSPSSSPVGKYKPKVSLKKRKRKGQKKRGTFWGVGEGAGGEETGEILMRC